MITVKVYYRSSGSPAKGSRVALGFDGLSRGVTKDQWTDDYGVVRIDADPGSGSVYVDGTTRHKGYLSGEIVVHI